MLLFNLLLVAIHPILAQGGQKAECPARLPPPGQRTSCGIAVLINEEQCTKRDCCWDKDAGCWQPRNAPDPITTTSVDQVTTDLKTTVTLVTSSTRTRNTQTTTSEAAEQSKQSSSGMSVGAIFGIAGLVFLGLILVAGVGLVSAKIYKKKQFGGGGNRGTLIKLAMDQDTKEAKLSRNPLFDEPVNKETPPVPIPAQNQYYQPDPNYYSTQQPDASYYSNQQPGEYYQPTAAYYDPQAVQHPAASYAVSSQAAQQPPSSYAMSYNQQVYAPNQVYSGNQESIYSTPPQNNNQPFSK